MAERAGTNELGAPASDAAESSTPQTPLSETRNPFADAGAISSSGSSSRSGSLNERHGAPRAVLHEDLRSEPPIVASAMPPVTSGSNQEDAIVSF
jgi:hypothetical protein